MVLFLSRVFESTASLSDRTFTLYIDTTVLPGRLTFYRKRPSTSPPDVRSTDTTAAVEANNDNDGLSTNVDENRWRKRNKGCTHEIRIPVVPPVYMISSHDTAAAAAGETPRALLGVSFQKRRRDAKSENIHAWSRTCFNRYEGGYAITCALFDSKRWMK